MFGMNWALAQRLPVSPRIQAWIVPGNGFLCILERQGSAISTRCPTTDDALRHGVAAVILHDAAVRSNSGTRLIFGTAPDGAREVAVHTHGSTVSIPVEEGVFILRDKVMNPPDQLTLVERGP